MKASTRGSEEIESPGDFARRLELPIEHLSLLARALTHRSYCNEHPSEVLEDNERLEFLGDAVLDFLVGAWLYHRFPEMREGELTRLRSALVRTEQLAEFAHDLAFGQAMRLGRGEGEGGGRQRMALLCATFEAVIGAIYLDGGLDSVRIFIEPLLKSAISRILVTNSDLDSKSVLQERIQSLGFAPPTYVTISAAGPEHQKTFEVEVLVDGKPFARGQGMSKQLAAKAAARAALDQLEIQPLTPAAVLQTGNSHRTST